MKTVVKEGVIKVKKFVAQLNDDSYINIFADRMEIKENILYVWLEADLVALVDVSVLLMAKLDNTQAEKR